MLSTRWNNRREGLDIEVTIAVMGDRNPRKHTNNNELSHILRNVINANVPKYALVNSTTQFAMANMSVAHIDIIHSFIT